MHAHALLSTDDRHDRSCLEGSDESEVTGALRGTNPLLSSVEAVAGLIRRSTEALKAVLLARNNVYISSAAETAAGCL